ncbi:MAG: PAS domain S-box protein [bacterium]
MKDEEKTKDQLINELAKLRQRIAELETTKTASRKQVEEALLESEETYKTLVKTSPDAVTLTDLEGKITELSQRTLELHGFNNAEELIGRNALEIIAPEDRERAIRNLQKTLTEDFIRNIEYTLLRKDGSRFIGELSASLIKNAYGKPKAFIATTRDITERKQAEKALKESEEKYRTLTENINVGAYRNTVGPKGKFIEANPAVVKMFGYKNKEEFFAVSVADLYLNPEDRRQFNEKMLKDGFVRNEELLLKTKNGASFIGSVSAVAVKDRQGKVQYYDGIIEDITERKRAEEELKRLATIDTLTEVLNRGSGLLFFNKQLKLSKRNNWKLSICYLDVNGLKTINDTYGHQEGDEALKLVSGFLKETIREGDIACRLGGDEFLLVLPQCPIDQARVVWKRMAGKVVDFNTGKKKPYIISLSHGIAECDPSEEKSVDQLLAIADREMYKTKHSKSTI